MDHRTFADLEFGKVLELIAGLAATVYGRERALSLRPLDGISLAGDAFARIGECNTVLSGEPGFAIPSIEDIRPNLESARIPGSMLDPKDLLRIAEALQNTARLKQRIVAWADKAPLLAQEAGGIADFRSVIDPIFRCIDTQGTVRDQASSELAQNRVQQREIRNRIIEKLQAILRGQERNAVEDELVVLRDGRYVIPVRADFRKNVKGIAIDYSKTRTTVFVEPFAVVEWNNELRRRIVQEQEEIERILRLLTESVTRRRTEIENALAVLAEIDGLFARARFMSEVNGICPQWNRGGGCMVVAGRHPLLAWRCAKPVVAQTFSIEPDIKGLLLTGPNAGGKTVCLKMMGLLQLLAQSGIPIPAGEGTRLPFHREIYTDIGDAQSIENSLSTFSAHMAHLHEILKRADASSLILLDELGTGTDPKEGAGLAMAYLDELTQKGVRVIATTHLGELKLYGEERPGILNASMEFDEQTFRPTYRLRMGLPGRSYAYEIARQLGLPGSLIERAKSYQESGNLSYEQALTRYQEQLKRLAFKEEELKGDQVRIDQTNADLSRRERERAAEMREFREKLQKEKRAEIAEIKEQFLAEMRKLSDPAARSGGHRFLSKVHKQVTQEKPSPASVPGPAREYSFEAGEAVRLRSNMMAGTVVAKLDAGRYRVAVGDIKVDVHASELSPVGDKEPVQRRAVIEYELSDVISPEVDLRGLKAEEAIEALEKYLDSVRLSSLHKVTVIHGKGTGKLRVEVAEFLKKAAGVKSFKLAEYNEGGTGATVVELDS